MTKALLIAVLAAASMNVHAEGGNNPFAVCKSDFERLCKNVQPGEGRQMKCMMDNKANLSGACAQAVSKKQEHEQKVHARKAEHEQKVHTRKAEEPPAQARKTKLN
jgi:hypothetical protein